MRSKHVLGALLGMSMLSASAFAMDPQSETSGAQPGDFWRAVLVPLPPVRPANLEAQQPSAPVATSSKKAQAAKARPTVVQVAMPTLPRHAPLRPFWMTVGTGF